MEIRVGGYYRVWTNRVAVSHNNDSVVKVTRIVVETPVGGIEISVTPKVYGPLNSTAVIYVSGVGGEYKGATITEDLVLYPNELVPYDRYKMADGVSIWGERSYGVEVSTLDGNKDRWPRNKCPHCGHYIHRVHVKPQRDEEGELTHWVAICGECNSKLTIFND